MYERPPIEAKITQGDILDGCPIVDLGPPQAGGSTVVDSRVIVLSQACDLAQGKTNRVLVAVVHGARTLVEGKVLKADYVRNDIRRGRVFGWYFLPVAAGPIDFPESIVDLRDLHTVHLDSLAALAAGGRRVCRLPTPYREHLAQHFAVTYMRIGLPEPYESEP